VKTAPLAEYQREARRLLRIADDLGLTREDLAERTGHSAALVDLALDPQHGRPLPLHVLHSLADTLGTAIEARDSMTLADAMAELAERLGDRVGDETRELIRVARSGADFAAIRRRLGAPARERPTEPPTLADILQALERASDAPESKRPEIEANLPGIVGLVDEPGFLLK
jgi:hypothetical protein